MTETVEFVVVEDPSVEAERIAVAGFLAGYRGNTPAVTPPTTAALDAGVALVAAFVAGASR